MKYYIWKEEYFEITGSHKSAMILNDFLVWHEHSLKQDEKLEEEALYHESKGNVKEASKKRRQKTDGLVFQPTRYIAKSSKGLFSKSVAAECIKLLMDKGFLSVAKKNQDGMPYYHVHKDEVDKKVQEWIISQAENDGVSENGTGVSENRTPINISYNKPLISKDISEVVPTPHEKDANDSKDKTNICEIEPEGSLIKEKTLKHAIGTSALTSSEVIKVLNDLEISERFYEVLKEGNHSQDRIEALVKVFTEKKGFWRTNGKGMLPKSMKEVLSKLVQLHHICFTHEDIQKLSDYSKDNDDVGPASIKDAIYHAAKENAVITNFDELKPFIDLFKDDYRGQKNKVTGKKAIKNNFQKKIHEQNKTGVDDFSSDLHLFD